MRVYEITTDDGEIQYHAAYTLAGVFEHTNQEWQGTVTQVKEIERDLSIREIENHKLPMGYPAQAPSQGGPGKEKSMKDPYPKSRELRCAILRLWLHSGRPFFISPEAAAADRRVIEKVLRKQKAQP